MTCDNELIVRRAWIPVHPAPAISVLDGTGQSRVFAASANLLPSVFNQQISEGLSFAGTWHVVTYQIPAERSQTYGGCPYLRRPGSGKTWSERP